MRLYMLKPHSEAVLKAIVQTDEQQRGRLRISDIAIRARVSEHTVRRHIRLLQTCGYITLKRAHSGITYSYEVADKAYQELNAS